MGLCSLGDTTILGASSPHLMSRICTSPVYGTPFCHNHTFERHGDQSELPSLSCLFFGKDQSFGETGLLDVGSCRPALLKTSTGLSGILAAFLLAKISHLRRPGSLMWNLWAPLS